MEFNLKIWRQKNAKTPGHFETYHISGIEEDASFWSVAARAVVPFPSITTAVKASAAPVDCILTAVHTVRTTM